MVSNIFLQLLADFKAKKYPSERWAFFNILALIRFECLV